MRNRKAVVAFVAVFLVGTLVGYLLGKGRQTRDPIQDQVAVPKEISVSRPDNREPTGFSTVRFKVLHSGSNRTGAGKQEANEHGVTLWYDAPERSENVSYFGTEIK